MTRTGPRIAAAALLAAALHLGPAAPGRADDPPRDEALDRILEKIDGTKPDADAPKGDADAPKGDAPAARPAEPRPPADAPKPSGEVAPKDEAIDNLLEKLGEAEEKPAAPGKPAPGAADAREDQPPQPGDAPRPDQPKPEGLKGRDKATDEHLEELTGRRHKKPMRDEDAGALADAIKQMREVEKRLSQPDTGDETRKQQQEIVKELDRVLEKCRTIVVRSQSRKPGPPKPGDQPKSPAESAGANPGNGQPGNVKPKLPKNDKNPNRDKHPWAHLQPEEQVEKDNAFAARPLPGKESLIERYFESVAKKGTSGGK